MPCFAVAPSGASETAIQSLLLRLSYHTPVQLGKSQKKKVFHFSESCGRLVSEKMGHILFLDKKLYWIPERNLCQTRRSPQSIMEIYGQGLQRSMAIDDFGTGYSSLNLLRDFSADVLKLDKSFIDGHTDTKRDSVVVSNVAKMARNWT